MHRKHRVEDNANTSDVNKPKCLFVQRAWQVNIDVNRTAVKASIRTMRRVPCRQYDRLSQQQLSFLFWYVCHAYLALYSSTDSGLFYSKSESGVHVTEMMNYDWSMKTVYVLMCFLAVVYVQITNSLSTSLSAMFRLVLVANIFIPDVYGQLFLDSS